MGLYDPSLFDFLTRAEQAELDRLLSAARAIWSPLPGPQTLAYYSLADIIGFGGAAGGGKTDLAAGKALTQHERSIIFRRNGTELMAIVDRMALLIGSRDAYNGKDNVWRLPDRQIEYGSVPNAGDETKYQGRPHDLIVLDEATNFLLSQVRFLLGWLRTDTVGQRCQALLTFNPPQSAEGRWVVEFFAPWLDKKHPCPAMPGELRWFATLPDNQGNPRDIELPDNRQFVVQGRERVYDFDPSAFAADEIITPLSRTFIPSRVTDNPYYMRTGYMAQLQALPEPMRSQMLKGDFNAGMEDDAYQVCPTAWVEAAMRRWKPRERKPEMLSIGVDVARGGKDQTVIARRHVAMWFDELLAYAGTATPDGPSVMAMTLSAWRDRAPVHIDVIGVGSSPYDFLRQTEVQTIGVNVAERATRTDKSGALHFPNLRSQLWWQMREALDPANNTGIELPPDQRLLADLCAPRWRPAGKLVTVESREEIYARIQRSPDYASAVILALMDTPRIEDIPGQDTPARGPHDPYERIQHDVSHTPQRQVHDPYTRLR